MPPRKTTAGSAAPPGAPGGWAPLQEPWVDGLDLAEETHLAVIRERVRNGTSDFQDARWLLGIVDKLLA